MPAQSNNVQDVNPYFVICVHSLENQILAFTIQADRPMTQTVITQEIKLCCSAQHKFNIFNNDQFAFPTFSALTYNKVD